MEFMPQKPTNNNEQSHSDEHPAADTELVFSPDGTAYNAEQAAAGYGMTQDTYMATSANPGNASAVEAYQSPYQQHNNTESNREEDGSILPFVGAVAGGAGIVYKTYEPFRDAVNESAEVALNASQQAFEFTADRPLLFAGVTALGIGAAAVKVWRDVRKHKHAANQEQQTYGNAYQAPDGSWKTIEQPH